MPDITFSSVTGIQHQLSVLDINKASGPDNVSPFILKHCSNEISPILQVIFTQSLDTGHGVLPSDWLKANVCPVFKNRKPNSCFQLSSNIFNIYMLQNHGAHYLSFCYTTSELLQCTH